MSGSPRVLQVVLSLNPGGTERLVIELVRRLAPEIAMAVCCLDEKGAWASQLEELGIRVMPLGRRGGFTPSLGREVARLARAHAADVVHCHHYSPFVYGALSRVWRPRSRVVFTEHGRLSDASPSGKRRLANTVLARAPHAVFAVSADLRRHLVSEGFPSRSVRVIYNGIELGPIPDPSRRFEIRSRLGIADDSTLVVGTIARLDPVKDLATLLRATADVSRQRSVELLVVGDGPERVGLDRLATELGIAPSTRFLGARDDARVWLAACDVYVNSSISEGVSLTILEAMAAALPVIATQVGGTPEVVTRDCGRLIPSRSPAVLERALLELAGDAGLRAALGTQARRRVEEKFSIDRMVSEYREVYHALSS